MKSLNKIMRYCGIILKLLYALTPFCSIMEQNRLRKISFSKIYYFEENQNLSTMPP